MSDIPEISVTDLKERLDRGEQVTIVDVREPHEWEIANLGAHGARLIPLGELADRADEIPTEGTVVLHCRSGGRSGRAVEYLRAQGRTNLLNLEGGILAWADEVDPSTRKY